MLRKELNKFGKNVVKFSRSNLTRKKKNVDKKLYNSISYTVTIGPNSFGLYFSMEEYGAFQDRGVSGKKRKFDTPFKFKNKMPPREPIFQWVKKRGLRMRDSSGKFTKGSQKSLSFLIQRSIYNKGIKPSLFFTKPFEAAFKSLPDDIVEAYGLDVEKLLKNSL
jgi:hypothetical protein